MTTRWVLGFLIFWGGMLGLFADGKVFPPTAYPLPDIPEQQALIYYANGIEKLVIQTSFTGQGTNFAWIVPLPAVPKIETVTTGLFPTLQFQLRPEVRHNETNWFGGLIALSALIRIFWKTRPTGSVTLPDWICCFAVGGGLALLAESIWPVLIFVPPLLLAVRQIRHGLSETLVVLLTIIFVLILSGMILPAFTTAGVSAAPTGSVIVHDRQTVGSYETAVVSAQKADELMNWLKVNGFATPNEITPVITDYIKDGWVFAAARLARPESKGSSAIHPLMFTFRTDKPVYPMRLTGVGNGNLKVDLYVFGAQRAKADHFSVSRCAEVSCPATNNYYYDTIEHLYVGHPGLSDIVKPATVATKLQAALTPAQMKQDVWLDWEPFQAQQAVLYSRRGAWVTSLNYVMPFFLLGLFIQDFERFQQRLGPSRWRRFQLRLVVLSLLSALAINLALPQVPVRLSKTRPWIVERLHNYQQQSLAGELDEIAKTNQTLVTSTWLSKNLEAYLKTNDVSFGLNPYSGQPCKQEDSPGNFRIEARTDDFDYFWYDRNGFEHKIPYAKRDSK